MIYFRLLNLISVVKMRGDAKGREGGGGGSNEEILML